MCIASRHIHVCRGNKQLEDLRYAHQKYFVLLIRKNWRNSIRILCCIVFELLVICTQVVVFLSTPFLPLFVKMKNDHPICFCKGGHFLFIKRGK